MNPLFKTIMTVALVAAVVGCAKENSGGGAPSVPATDPNALTTANTGSGAAGTGNNPSVTGYYSGSTAAMSNYSGLGSFFYRSNPQQPTNVRINIDMNRAKDSVIVSYQEGVNGRIVEAGLGTVHPYSGVQDNSYNQWYTENGKSVFKGFYQDQFGAIIVIVNRTSGADDGVPSTFLGGEVWFQNFNGEFFPNYPQQGPERMCWQIEMGPYDCRSFLVDVGTNSEHIDMTSSPTPTTRGPDKSAYYQKLGEFDGIDGKMANFPSH